MKYLLLITLPLAVFFQGAARADVISAKWHPGNYMLVTTGYSQSDFDTIQNDPNILGAQVRYSWRDLETSEGVYDFSKIASDLAYLQAMGKRLVIQIQTKTFGDGSQAAPVPDYILTDPTYDGGMVENTDSSSGSYGTKVAMLWNTAVNNRLIALYKALGERFDTEDYVEAINTTESALSLTTAQLSANGYDADTYATALEDDVNNLKQAFPSTTVLSYVNYLNLKPGNIANVASSAHDASAGIGGPDLVIPNPSYGITAPPSYQYFGSGGYGGQMPLGLAVQNQSYVDADSGFWTLGDLLDYGVNDLSLNYIFWARKTWGTNQFSDAVAAVNASSNKINSTLPSNQANRARVVFRDDFDNGSWNQSNTDTTSWDIDKDFTSWQSESNGVLTLKAQGGDGSSNSHISIRTPTNGAFNFADNTVTLTGAIADKSNSSGFPAYNNVIKFSLVSDGNAVSSYEADDAIEVMIQANNKISVSAKADSPNSLPVLLDSYSMNADIAKFSLTLDASNWDLVVTDINGASVELNGAHGINTALWGNSSPGANDGSGDSSLNVNVLRISTDPSTWVTWKVDSVAVSVTP